MAGAACEVTAGTENRKWFTLTLLRLKYLSEQHLGKVTMQASSFCQHIFKMYLQKYFAKTTTYTFHYAAASPLAALPHWYTYRHTPG